MMRGKEIVSYYYLTVTHSTSFDKKQWVAFFQDNLVHRNTTKHLTFQCVKVLLILALYFCFVVVKAGTGESCCILARTNTSYGTLRRN